MTEENAASAATGSACLYSATVNARGDDRLIITGNNDGLVDQSARINAAWVGDEILDAKVDDSRVSLLDEVDDAIETVRNVRGLLQRSRDDILAANVRFGEIPDFAESDRVACFSAAVTGLGDVLDALERAGHQREPSCGERLRAAVAYKRKLEEAGLLEPLAGSDPEADALARFQKRDAARLAGREL